MKKEPPSVAIKTMAMAIPAIAPVPIPWWEPLSVVLIMAVLLEVGTVVVVPVVLTCNMATIWLGTDASKVACEIEKLDCS